MRVVYMGTPDFAVAPLKSISEAGHEVIGVYTQPDKPKGRSNKLVASDVKKASLEIGLPVFQPEKLREAEVVEELRGLNPDIIVVAAYGQILSEEVLSIPPYGCINIHASLLPKYRGASPIEASIINGDEKTGVTIMYMAKGLDTGDIISQADIEIGLHNTETLTAELSKLGADLVVKTMKDIESGAAERTVQDDTKSCYCGKLTKDMGRLSFEEPAVKLERLVRGLYPWPCAYMSLGGKTMKIIDSEVVEQSGNEAPGTITEVTKKYFVIKCAEGGLKIKKLQPEGKKPMDTAAFLNGTRLQPGETVV